MPVCPFCRVAMQLGVILDRSAGTNVQPTWIPEPVETSWFGSLREPQGPHMLVATYRCSSCGYLASYAQPQHGANILRNK
jgi:hypothetical protein